MPVVLTQKAIDLLKWVKAKEIGTGDFGCAFYPVDKKVLKVKYYKMVENERKISEYIQKHWIYTFPITELFKIALSTPCDKKTADVYSEKCSIQLDSNVECLYEDYAGSTTFYKWGALWDGQELSAAQLTDLLGLVYRLVVMKIVMNSIPFGHNDLHNNNIMIDMDWKPYLIDFGNAKPYAQNNKSFMIIHAYHALFFHKQQYEEKLIDTLFESLGLLKHKDGGYYIANEKDLTETLEILTAELKKRRGDHWLLDLTQKTVSK